jgi:hypothetical protein
LVSSVRWEITRAVGSAHQSVFVALRRVRHEETVLMRLVRLRQRRWLLEHLVVKSTVDDSVPHAENVPFAQLQHIQKHKKKCWNTIWLRNVAYCLYLVAGSASGASQVEDSVTGSHGKFVRS